MWEASPWVLVAKFPMVLELQAIKFENANFHTKMDCFVVLNSMAHNSRTIENFATKTVGEASTLVQTIEEKLVNFT